ncbi:hypothetical protein [Psychroserpens luteus]|uniref:Uncharacterized protein n=1 Tax=Psychroserpens luteus TaxID=1434066 RepID=A0ABW5ZQ92_9FLAO|nr:hypothetical protein [Psychroserpens luteus]
MISEIMKIKNFLKHTFCIILLLLLLLNGYSQKASKIQLPSTYDFDYTYKLKMTMDCVDLDKTDFSINASAYGSMISAFGN